MKEESVIPITYTETTKEGDYIFDTTIIIGEVRTTDLLKTMDEIGKISWEALQI
jgi:hypothetical protein